MIPFTTFDELRLEEEFIDSEFSGIDVLLNIDYLRLRFASSEDSEQVEELYYFIESNGEVKKDEDNFVLYELDEIKFVLLDLINKFYIIIKAKDLEEVQSMFE